MGLYSSHRNNNKVLCYSFAVVIFSCCLSTSVVAAGSNAVTIDTALYDDLGITLHDDSDANTGKIIDGQIAPVGKYPTFVTTENPRVLCGGVLIWPDIVMSAAHCEQVFDQLKGVVRIGGTIYNKTTSNAIEKIRIKDYFIFPSYDDDIVGRYDIMLILLNQTSNVTASPYNTNPALPVDGQNAVVIGHGRTSDFFGGISDLLKEATVKTVGFQTCLNEYAGYEGSFCSNETFCAVRGTGVHCNGDSGGPLFDPTTGAVIGIVSFGDSFSCASKPNGYTRVSTFAPWIREIICNNSAVKTSGCPAPPPPATSPIAAAPVAPPSAPTAPSSPSTNTTNTSLSLLMTTMSAAATATDGFCTLLEDVPRLPNEDLFCSDPPNDDGAFALGDICSDLELNHMHQRRFFFFCREDCVEQEFVNRKRLFGWRCGPCP